MSEQNVEIIIEILKIYAKADEEARAKIQLFAQTLTDKSDVECRAS